MADQRKQWLAQFDPDVCVDHNIKVLTYQDFIHKELIHFSNADNLRSIPSVIDGLKPGQRKILFACFKRKLKNEIKVAQLSGYVAEHSAYHHGEMSLCSTIVNMAQDFVGSNNINLLMPIGQFGTRSLGGKEAASPRYIFTNLNPMTRMIFSEEDDHLMNYIEEEGMTIEPTYYVPVIPVVLVNGTEGIGTGWSTSIPQFNPLDIIENIEAKLRSQEFKRMMPWSRGFRGAITSTEGNKFTVEGIWTKQDKHTIKITELPLKRWTTDTKELLEQLMQSGEVTDMKEFHKDNTVDFEVKF